MSMNASVKLPLQGAINTVYLCLHRYIS